MVDFGKLLGKKEEEDEEDEEKEDDIDSIVSGAGGEPGAGAEEEGGIGAGGPQGSGGMGVAPDIRDDIDRNREDIRELEANVDSMGDTVEDMDERVKDIEEDISQLLDVYEMVTAEFNPFLDEEDALSGGVKSSAEDEADWGMEGLEEDEEEDEEALDELIQPPDEEEETEEDSEEPAEMPDLEEPAEDKTEPVQEPAETETEPEPVQEPEPPEQAPKEEGTDNINKFIEDLEPGKTYLLKTSDEDFIYESFKAMIDGTSGLCITRKHPDDLRERYDYGEKNVDFGWLSTSKEQIAIAPDELDILGLTVERFISDEGGVILLDGIGYLLSNNPDSTLIHFIQSLQDQITVGNTKFLIALDPSDIEEENMKLIKNELDVEVKEKEEYAPDPEPKDTVTEEGQRGRGRGSRGKRGEENLVAKVKRMMDFLDEQERALERKIDRVSTTSSVDVSDKVASRGVMDAIEGLEKEIQMLGDELKRLKERQLIEGEKKQKEEEETEGPKEEEIEEFVKMVEKGEDLQEELEDLKEEIKMDDDRREEKERDEDEIELERPEKKVIETEPEKEKYKSNIEDKSIISEDKEMEAEPEKEEEVISESEKERSAIYTENEIKLQAEVSGDIASGSGVEIQKDVTVKGSLTAEGDILLHDRATVEGDVISKSGDVKVGKDCTINGKISGNTVLLSEESAAQIIDAAGDVDLGRSTHVRKVSSGGDVRISEKVQIEDGIDYGGKLIFEGSEIAIGDLVNPFAGKEKKEVVKERWASR